MLPRVSVVLLSYDRPQLLAASVRAVLAQTLPPDEVLVVDNASPRAAEVAAVVAAFPGVRLVALPTNLGLAAGMNLGLREVSGERVLLTEDDIVLAPAVLEQFVRAAEATPEPVLFSAVMRDRDTGTVRYAGGQVALGSIFRIELPHRGARRLDGPAIIDTGYLAGAVVFGPATTLRALGPYREEYFMYFEDVELSLRCRAAGVRLAIVRDPEVTHFTPRPGLASPLVEFHKRKNMLATYLLHAPLAALPVALVRYAVLEVLRGTVVRRDATLPRSVGWVVRRAAGLLRQRRAVRTPWPSARTPVPGMPARVGGGSGDSLPVHAPPPACDVVAAADA